MAQAIFGDNVSLVARAEHSFLIYHQTKHPGSQFPCHYFSIPSLPLNIHGDRVWASLLLQPLRHSL
jgi:hypothetical protein